MRRTRITRRDFMTTTAGAALAVPLGGLMLDPDAYGKSAYSLSAASPRPVPPSDTVRFGIIGVGMQGSGLMATSIKLPGVECVAACDLYDGRIELAKEIAEKTIFTTKRYKELLERNDVDCIIAAVPDHWHRQIVVDCTNAGKDVYCEKPMTHHVPEGFDMIEAAATNNRIVQIGSQRRSSVVYRKAKELYEQGAVGEVCLVEAVMGRNDPCGAWVYTIPPDLSPETVDWENWLGSAPKRPFDPKRWTRWRCFQDYGEGIPGDLFVHLLTGIHTIADITAPPARASSAGGLFRWKDGRDVPDCISTIYDYPKFHAMLRVTLNTDAQESTTFYGTGGQMEVHDDRVTVWAQDGMDHGPCTPGWPKKLRADFAEPWHADHDPKPGSQQIVPSQSFYTPPGYNDDREHLWNYFNSVRTRQPSVEDATFGNHTAIACHMANYSYEHKAIAVWNAAAKEIKS
ncbi:MAG: gfo/Idh/MocA family oxidoreductase [Acidobacteria bacterium]|nr:MAG: gfo/Idh/MocA family oxidoreductase [Acidobacteriota bacterium]